MNNQMMAPMSMMPMQRPQSVGQSGMQLAELLRKMPTPGVAPGSAPAVMPPMPGAAPAAPGGGTGGLPPGLLQSLMGMLGGRAAGGLGGGGANMPGNEVSLPDPISALGG